MLVEEIKKTSIKAPSGRNIILYAFTFRPDGALGTTSLSLLLPTFRPDGALETTSLSLFL